MIGLEVLSMSRQLKRDDQSSEEIVCILKKVEIDENTKSEEGLV